ncbi:unnamed protein product [Haemonchus placei]|uniref:Transmembrane protein n=1 Tax=Haemonchus placei TaxID=6290 RepID=A0A158QN93_HAEPC|nr:unnamed protein product [Haemonchus placei]
MTVNPKSTNLPMNSATPNITMTPSIMGPFKLVLRWSGLDLSEASIEQSGWLKTVRIVVVCILICLPIFIKSLLLITFDTRPMSLEWATILVLAFMALNGLCSALCVAAWTKSQFLPKLQEVLAKVQNQRSPLCGKTGLTGTYRKIVIGTVAFMIL